MDQNPINEIIKQHQPQRIIIPQQMGKGVIENIKIHDGFHIYKSDYKLNNPIEMEVIPSEKKLIIAISKKGDTKFKNLNGETIDCNEGFTTISNYLKAEGFNYISDKPTQQIRVVLDEEFLERNLKESQIEKIFYSKENIKIFSFSPTTLSSEVIITDIFECTLLGGLRSIYIQSKALELLYLEILKLKKDKDDVFLDKYDIDAIYKAKEILIENMQNPPSIVELAKRVCLNEFKLKKGFKQVFNTTPYKLLTQHKMNYAKKLLKSSDYNITEIANIVGYKFPNNFTYAFYSEFKINPKDIMKNRKYYY